MTKIISDKPREELEQEAANIIEQNIKSLLKDQDQVVFAIPGGRSVAGIFNNLKEKDIPWDKIHIFMVDERMVSITDKDSNYKLAKESFLDYLVSEKQLPKENIHPFEVDKGIEDYEAQLKEVGSKYDIVLLSSGEDGHIGALYTKDASGKKGSVNDNSEYFLTMDNSPKDPPNRMTMSKKLLLRSKVAILLFFGEAKREALNKFKDEKIDPNSCPAKLVHSIKDSYALTDLK